MEFGDGGSSGRAKWSLWAQMPKAELWQAVALSIDRSPGEWGYGCRSAGRFNETYAREDFGTGFWDRMRIAQASLSASGPLRAFHLSVGIHRNPRAEVSLPEFGSWAESKGWTLPTEFPRILPIEPIASPPTDQQDKPLGNNERNSLLTIIAALCDYSDIDLNSRGTVSLVVKMTEEIGAAVSDDTVRKHLANVRTALESRKR